MNTLNSEAFALFGQHIKWADMIGNVIGLLALVLGRRRSLWSWPAQILSSLVLFAAFAPAHLTGSAGKQVVVMVVAAWGWAQWIRGRKQAPDGSLDIRFATRRERIVMLAGTVLGTIAVATLFTTFPTLSWDPWPDACLFVGTVVAMYAQARGMVEFWFAWLLVNLVGIPLNFTNGFAFSGLVYALYSALVLWGLRDWWLRSRAVRTPALQGAATP
ncbi:nicotinamide riboside transporter PnuC [Streptomyces sp. NPDC085932]|uniref:nicotinamide riboside transporter PnuC n=1 Tax=Streptomyces sp. NPDC085932 TaxID=3365741 RepID=UPI0037D8AE8D